MGMKSIYKIFYRVKPWVPRGLQLALRRRMVLRKRAAVSNVWPIDPKAGASPRGWTGWPGGKRFAVVLTHDVESAEGAARCVDLAEKEGRLGFRSSFNFVPERYPVPRDVREDLARKGFEVGCHGLCHDGKYFESWELFSSRAEKINRYLKDWNAVGFRTPSMLHKLEWLHVLDIEYDMSTFDTDPFEPQADGECTIFPFLAWDTARGDGYVELPYTLPQDFTLYILMKERDNGIWKRKLDWIAENGGMALINVHPDYLDLDGKSHSRETYPATHYEEWLEYVSANYAGQYWNALPREVAFFMKRDNRHIVREINLCPGKN